MYSEDLNASPLAKELETLRIIEIPRLQQFYPRVRDRQDIAVLRDPVTEVIVLSSSDHMSLDYYESKPELAGSAVHGHVTESHPPLEDDIRRAEEFGALLRNKRWLDFGCGLGGVLDEMKGQATWMAGLEPSRERAAITIAKGHTIIDSLTQVPLRSLDVISMFHVLEHLTSPLQTLVQVRERLKPGGTVLLEVPHARDVLFTLYDSEAFKRFTFWSEHLVLHTRQSLRILLEQAGFTQIEIRSKQRYPLSNHLHWLVKQKPGGHQAWSFMNSAGLHTEYEATLSRIDRTDSLIAFAHAPPHE